MNQIKFGTDGWRAIIAKEYTVDNVLRVSEGTAKWMTKAEHDSVVIGYDCRFGGTMFAEAASSALIDHGITVHVDKNFVTTPMVSLGVLKLSAGLGIVITASHNPPSYNGYKLKASYGGPSIPADIAAVEALIPETSTSSYRDFKELEKTGKLHYVDLEQMYLDHIRASFDMQLIQSQQQSMAYDAMYGAGQNVMKKLFPKATLLHCDYNPSFLGTAPEPIDRNLRELSKTIAADSSLTFGIAHDGDADRIGMYDEDGIFVDSHRLLLLLLKYLYEYKEIKTGKVVCSISVTNKLKRLAEFYGLEYVTTKIGFKYIAEIMGQEQVLVGGEESGGIAVSGHIPERDGVWTGLLLLEFMAKTGKTLKQLLDDVYDQVGRFDYYRDDLHLKEEQKQRIIKACANGELKMIGDLPIVDTDDLDGYKFILGDDTWVMIRPSGTEPVLRFYCQAEDMQKVRAILDKTKKTVLAL